MMENPATKVKALLFKRNSENHVSLYDHLVQVLMKVIDEETHNPVEIFEDLSLHVKLQTLEEPQNVLKDLLEPSAADLLSDHQRLLFVHKDDQEEDMMVDLVLPNINELSFFLDQAGLGLGTEEMYRIFLSLKHLVDSEPLLSCRLWGKILGTRGGYIIAEAESREGMEEEEEEEVEEEEEEEEHHDNTKEQRVNEDDPVPQTNFKAPSVVPKEALGTGANRFIYYVCNEPGLPWVKLPLVSPAHITAARRIRKFFTGRLDASIVSYPPFPGNESNYLRAQIARISAGSQTSPRGFYQMMEDEGDEDEHVPRETYDVNPDFEGIPPAEMSESLSTWVHHVPHILHQGRCSWFNLNSKKREESTEEEGDEREHEDEPEPEVGPSLMTPVSQDSELLGVPPWSTKLSTRLIPQHAVVVLHSNLWPGAVTYACGKKFDNMYVGWGLKYAGEGHSPDVPPPPQMEAPGGPHISEAVDPSVEEEKVLEEEQEVAQEKMEESEEDQEDEDDEDEDEDDDE